MLGLRDLRVSCVFIVNTIDFPVSWRFVSMLELDAMQVMGLGTRRISCLRQTRVFMRFGIMFEEQSHHIALIILLR